ncbi:hypothetical protein PBCV1_a286aR [Paramecium bursaria Chlorella virus 1]|uniref:Uncharacterized protein n=1 Tax=Paramecium bursaria Chlorella virus 1 TaxID=10506 RepID=F8TU12_PBCV1|nr:hypothetical protein PBCV1_a286aR [Paramecium bursaria Chlorella virus 1]AEI70073.1 hypothetical protein [Paramecium bursaria Chlorella virus 1]
MTNTLFDMFVSTDNYLSKHYHVNLTDLWGITRIFIYGFIKYPVKNTSESRLRKYNRD